MNRKLLGVKLKERRKELGESMESLADGFISAATIGNIERGMPNVSEEKCIYYAEKLGLGNELFGILSDAEKQEQEAEVALMYLEDILSADYDQSLQKLEGEFQFLAKDSRLSPLYQFLIGRCYFGKRDNGNKERMLARAEKHFRNVIALMEAVPELESTNLKAASLNELGRIYYYRQDLQSALTYTNEGLSVFFKDGERQENILFLLMNQAIYYERLNEDERALERLEELWERTSGISGTKVLAVMHLDAILQMYIISAEVLTKVKHYNKALEFANEGVDIARKNSSFDKLVSLWTTIGIIYENSGDMDEAERFYVKAIAIREKVTEQSINDALTNLGMLYIKKKRYQEALEIIQDAIHIAKKYKDEMTMLDTLNVLGNCYLEQGSYEDAIKPFTQAYTLAEKYSLVKKQYEISVSLCYCYKNTENLNHYQYHLENMFELQTQLKWGGNH